VYHSLPERINARKLALYGYPQSIG
jgi:hypothetical protein